MGNHCRSADGANVTVADDGRTPLTAGLAAGATIDLDLTVTAPSTPGRHLLEADLVEEGVCWFGDRGSPTATAKVKLKGDRRPSGPTVPVAEQSEATEDAGVFEMHGPPRERVEAAVQSSGAVIVHVEPSERGGDNWDGFRYIARRPAD